MTWTGDIYEQVSGDYRIKIDFTISGEFCVIRHGKEIIGYTNDTDAAKAKCAAQVVSNLSKASHELHVEPVA